LRHCATNRKVAGSRLDEANEFFSTYLALKPVTELVLGAENNVSGE
jgi:hypothetical protein